MKSKLEVCPTCLQQGVSPWAPLFASWPFSARCQSCGTRLRVRIPHWQNVLAQLLSQVVMWAFLLYGLVQGGLLGLSIGAVLGIVVGLLVALLPGFFSKLEPVPGSVRAGARSNEP